MAKILGLEGVCSMHGGMFYLQHVKVIWGYSVHFSENWAIFHSVSHQLSTVHLGSSAQEILSPTDDLLSPT